jgi:hypothetical protein
VVLQRLLQGLQLQPVVAVVEVEQPERFLNKVLIVGLPTLNSQADTHSFFCICQYFHVRA